MNEPKNTDHKQPRQLFLNTLVEFHDKLGSREFWANTKQREIALEAVTQDYMRTEHGENLKEDAISLQVAINEYHTRESYILRR